MLRNLLLHVRLKARGRVFSHIFSGQPSLTFRTFFEDLTKAGGAIQRKIIELHVHSIHKKDLKRMLAIQVDTPILVSSKKSTTTEENLIRASFRYNTTKTSHLRLNESNEKKKSGRRAIWRIPWAG